MSGGGGVVDALSKMGPSQGSNSSSMPAYGSKTVSPTANRYTPTYTPMQQSSQQTPLQQSPQQNVQDMGLEALYQSMASQYAPISQQQNPMDRFYQQPMQQQMPTYGNSYKPNMLGVTDNLKRVAPSVQEQQRLQAIEDARRAAEEAANAPPPTYGGGG
jgi:phosphopentomutase